MAITDDIANLIARSAVLFTGMEGFKNQQVELVAGWAEDPDSFDKYGGKTGPLGYYPVTNANGVTVYRACEDRLWKDLASLYDAAETAKAYGAVGDGVSRTVQTLIRSSATSKYYDTFADLQVDYPFLTSVNDPLDYAGLQRAFNTGKDVLIPDGVFDTGSKQLVFPTGGRGIYGLNSGAGASNVDAAIGGAFIRYTPPAGTPDQAALKMTGSLQRIAFLKFLGDETSVGNMAILAQKNNNNNDDLDISIRGCQFDLFNRSIVAYGRGLEVRDCTFTKNKSGYGITSDWPYTGNSGDEGQTGELWKGRAYRIIGNRQHGSGTLINHKNYLARGALVAQNLGDTGARLIVVETNDGGPGASGFIESLFALNIFQLTQSSPVTFGRNCKARQIEFASNSFGGASGDGTVAGQDRRPFAAVIFNGCAEVNGILWNGGSIQYTDGHAVSIQNDVEGGLTGPADMVPTGIVFKGTMFKGIGQSGTARAIFNSVYDVNGLEWEPGAITEPGASLTSFVKAAGKTITNFVGRKGIAPDSIAMVDTATTIAGRNSAVHVEGAYSVKTNGQVRIGNLGAYNGAFPVEFNRDNSPFGVGVRFVNANGAIVLTGTADALGGGKFTTDTTDLIDWGASDSIFRRSYVTTRYWTGSVFDGSGTGAPEGAITGDVGSTWRDRTTGRLYGKLSGNGTALGWVDITKTAFFTTRAKLFGNGADGVTKEIGVAAPLQLRNGAVRIRPNVAKRRFLESSAWLTSASAADQNWYSVCYSPSLGRLCAVSSTGTGFRVMTSDDHGATWTLQATPIDNSWVAVCWSEERQLFVAVANSGTMNRCMTSPDGKTWTLKTTPQIAGSDPSWSAICYSPELDMFVAVASGGGNTTNRCMVSTDGAESWQTRSTPSETWRSVCWSPELRRFIAVGNSSAGNRIMTSTTGSGWTAVASPADLDWRSVCWAPWIGTNGRFIAVAASGTGQRVMTSDDGLTGWTLRNTPADQSWQGIVAAPDIGLLLAVSATGIGQRAMTSVNGEDWTLRNTPADNSWLSVCWSSEFGLAAAVGITGTGNRAMTSKSAHSLTYR